MLQNRTISLLWYMWSKEKRTLFKKLGKKEYTLQQDNTQKYWNTLFIDTCFIWLIRL